MERGSLGRLLGGQGDREPPPSGFIWDSIERVELRPGWVRAWAWG